MRNTQAPADRRLGARERVSDASEEQCHQDRVAGCKVSVVMRSTGDLSNAREAGVKGWLTAASDEAARQVLAGGGLAREARAHSGPTMLGDALATT